MQLETKFLRLRTPVVIHLFAVRNGGAMISFRDAVHAVVAGTG
jgi:hypothetical protein